MMATPTTTTTDFFLVTSIIISTVLLIFTPVVVVVVTGQEHQHQVETSTADVAASAAAQPKYKPIESPCLCQEFRCSDGSACLDKSRVCNGYRDCPGGEDEMIHTLDPSTPCVRKNPSKCNVSSEFKCKFGGCIRVEEVCDGVVHCFGGVDEATDLCTYLFS